ncbi:hypothetical protein ACB092_12G050800 [Castanea dentata]
MSSISSSNKFFTTTTDTFSSITTTPPPNFPKFPTFHQPKLFPKLLPTPTPHLLTHSSRKSFTPAFSKSSEEAEELSAEPEDEWLNKLPDKKKPLYSHSLPCIEAWLRSLGFYQSKEDRAVWLVEKPEWHAQLSLDVTDLYIRKIHVDKKWEFQTSWWLLGAFDKGLRKRQIGI